jgi:glycosyltransferase involved in cell wall biosynthesis
MDLVMFCHPSFMSSQSMPRFAKMLRGAYETRGHRTQIWSPRPTLFGKVPRGRLSKWAGYVDQYVLFPMWVRKELKRTSPGTLFVFCDQALGPWVPLVESRPHVVHVHDLLALRSALGDVPENPTSMTGRVYQRYIRRGFCRARHFISISGKTRNDLHRFGGVTPVTSEVVYNGMNYPYAPLAFEDSERILHAAGLAALPESLLLHVGGGQWYKNLAGVIAIYSHYAGQVTDPLPLWCVSPEPTRAVRSVLSQVPERGRVRFLSNLDSATLQALYSRASAFLFPSLAEGFGWPLIEAQACGCPVITTDEPPMNEVAGAAALYLPRLKSPAEMEVWSARGAALLRKLLAESAPDKARRREIGQVWVKRFEASKAIDGYLAVYRAVLDVTLSQRAGEPGLDQSTQV